MRLAALATLLALTPVLTRAEDRAPTVKEAQAAFAQADRALNEVWATLKASLPPADFAALKEKQKDWLAYRDTLAAGIPGGDGNKKAQASADDLAGAASLTEDRTKWLRALLAKPPETLTGRWIDSFGGELDLVQQGAQLSFVLDVVRGASAANGEIAGVAAWNPPIGWFSDKTDKDRDPGRTDETNLCFVLSAGALEVTSANAGYYAGARAYFDGRYVKVDSLDAKQRADVIAAGQSGSTAK